MSKNYNDIDKDIFEDYQDPKNIFPKHRESHYDIMGTYHNNANKYNPIKLISKFPNENDCLDDMEKIKFSEAEIN